MIDQRKRIFAVNLWLTDLALTTASFFLAYRFRLLFEVKGHTVMPVQVYLWLLAIILPIWAFLLPLFRDEADLVHTGRITLLHGSAPQTGSA